MQSSVDILYGKGIDTDRKKQYVLQKTPYTYIISYLCLLLSALRHSAYVLCTNRSYTMRLFSTLLVSFFFSVAVASAGDDTPLFDAVLQKHVHNGAVDYQQLKNDKRLDRYIEFLRRANPDKLPSQKAKLAFWINAYNAWTLKIICNRYPVQSIMDLAVQKDGKSVSPWDQPLVTVNNTIMTLNEIEHKIIRPTFKDARIHFALVCAAKSCPILRSEAYIAQKLDEQLDEQARIFLRDMSKNSFNTKQRTVSLSQLFDWYADDFGGKGEALLRYIAPYAPSHVSAQLQADAQRWKIQFNEYSWDLNE